MPSIIHAMLSKIRDSIAASVYNKLFYSNRAQQLTYLALSSREKGIFEGTKGGTEIIVSLTTHGRRLYEVYLGIESIMQGSVKPNRIVLWLSKDLQASPLPQTLLNQIDRGLLLSHIKYHIP